MKKLSNLLVLPCVVGLFLGVSGVGNDMVSGFALAIGAVTFILAFITRLIEKAEADSAGDLPKTVVTKAVGSGRLIGQNFQHQT